MICAVAGVDETQIYVVVDVMNRCSDEKEILVDMIPTLHSRPIIRGRTNLRSYLGLIRLKSGYRRDGVDRPIIQTATTSSLAQTGCQVASLTIRRQENLTSDP